MRWWWRWWKGPLLWWGKPPSRHPTLLSASVTECILGNDRRAGSPTSSIMIASRNITNVLESIWYWTRVLGGLNPDFWWREAIFGLFGTWGNHDMVDYVTALDFDRLLRFESRSSNQQMNRRLARTNQQLYLLHKNQACKTAPKWCFRLVTFNYD